MSKLMLNVKQLKMNKSIKCIWQLIISTSNATLEVPSLRPCAGLDQVVKELFLLLFTQRSYYV